MTRRTSEVSEVPQKAGDDGVVEFKWCNWLSMRTAKYRSRMRA